MTSARLIVLKVHYERWPTVRRSLGWIAPELDGAGMTLVEDQMDDERPSRTWTGVIDGSTFDHFAQAWRLHDDTDGAGLAGFYVLDGMNWESNGQSPIVCVTLKVFAVDSAVV